MPQFRVISIGTLAANPLWGERAPAREAHATTTLIEAGDRLIIVNPSLPPQILLPRMQSRTSVSPDAITDVFLTSRDPSHYLGISLFDKAAWWMAEADRAQLKETRKVKDAPDSFGRGVDLFPLPGVTIGTTGLLLSTPSSTILITGDAIASQDHLEKGMVLASCEDFERAQESFREAIEIADILVLGRDNAVLNPVRGSIGRFAAGAPDA
jgi:glyoxylase-like metal-dependent hydrolase (beta-lactamase superfamily II)